MSAVRLVGLPVEDRALVDRLLQGQGRLLQLRVSALDVLKHLVEGGHERNQLVHPRGLSAHRVVLSLGDRARRLGEPHDRLHDRPLDPQRQQHGQREDAQADGQADPGIAPQERSTLGELGTDEHGPGELAVEVDRERQRQAAVLARHVGPASRARLDGSGSREATSRR